MPDDRQQSTCRWLIAKSADFAQPILQRRRDTVHDTCPGAMRLNEEGVKVAGARKATPKQPVEVPDDLAAVKSNANARKAFDGFSPSARRECVEWLTEAKRGETRRKPFTQAVGCMAEGKQRHWKYQNC